MSEKRRWSRNPVVWTLAQAGWTAFVVWALLGDVGWAANVFRFWVWLGFVMKLLGLGLSMVDDTAVLSAYEGHRIPIKVALAWDMAIALFVASQGWFWYATMLTASAMIEGLQRTEADKRKAACEQTEDDGP